VYYETSYLLVFKSTGSFLYSYLCILVTERGARFLRRQEVREKVTTASDPLALAGT